MKKYLFLFCVFIIVCHSAQAQFKKGNKVINVGIGTNPDYFGNGAPFTAAFEYGFANWFSAGVNADAMVGDFQLGSVVYNYIGFCPGLRASIHLSQINIKNLDLYIGGSVGQNEFIWGVDPVVIPKSYQSGTYVIGYVGARFTIVKALGAFTEVSAGEGATNNVRLGLALIIQRR